MPTSSRSRLHAALSRSGPLGRRPDRGHGRDGFGTGGATRHRRRRRRRHALRRQLPGASVGPRAGQHLRPVRARTPTTRWGCPPTRSRTSSESVQANWATMAQIGIVAPSMVDDPAWCRWRLRSQRLAFAPDDAAAGWRTITATNVHHVLASIQAPTLVLHRRGDRYARCRARPLPGRAHSRCGLPGARGDDHMLFAGDTEALLDEIEEFLTGARPPVETNRVLVTDALHRHRELIRAGRRPRRRALAHAPRRPRRRGAKPTGPLPRSGGQHDR